MDSATTQTPPPIFSLSIYAPDGQVALELAQHPFGPITLQGDPSYLEHLVHALNTIRFFRTGDDHRSAASHN